MQTKLDAVVYMNVLNMVCTFADDGILVYAHPININDGGIVNGYTYANTCCIGQKYDGIETTFMRNTIAYQCMRNNRYVICRWKYMATME